MTVTADMILTDFGAILPLDQRRRDALAAYARAAAKEAGARSAQAWVEQTWDFRDYEAKDLLKGGASEALWERIVKHKRGGWRVVIPVMGAVIGHGLEDFIQQERHRLARERDAYVQREARLTELETHLRDRRRLRRAADRQAVLPHGRAAGEPGIRTARMGDRQADD